jgi:hypothetical protein
MAPEMEAQFADVETAILNMHPVYMVAFLALLPAVCEELFFRGYALSGLRGGIGKVAAVLIVALAFAINHHSIHRLFITGGLGILFGILVLRYRSIWPAMLAHLLHNGLTALSASPRALQPLLERIGYTADENGPPILWTAGAFALLTCGVLIVIFSRSRDGALETAAPIREDGAIKPTGDV